ncbi:MAG: DotH/IcmK family type IV secretion protein [Alphaproteobacteria bacterium]|jgi:intracellular multiplication protein IcmK|nr:DotH/IcmK family type IV secretion protein [Alphaproteobacteria bacterium]MCV6599804.1 DotH/IcmK family type IV secretion protein [Alphaproteobacteria bacterium]
MFKKQVLFIFCALFLAFNANAETETEKISSAAYELAKDNALPMSTEQIMDFLKEFRKSQKASVVGQGVYPEKRVRIEMLSLDPGENIPTVNVSQGYVTTVSFLDATGSSWPIIDVVSGGNFDVTSPEPNGHIIRITPKVRYGYGNLSVRLRGLEFPVTLNIEVDDDYVDYRFDAKVPLKGPNSKLSILQQSNIASAGNPVLSSILEGVVPSDLKKITIKSGDLDGTTVYQNQDKLYVRTNSTLLSPRWTASASISEGVKVYVTKAYPILLFSDNGEVVKLKLNLLKEM